MMEILRKDTKLLTLAATLMIYQLFGGKDDAFIAEQQRAMAEAQELIHQGQAALQENNLSEATDRFIAGYWKFRQVLTDIWFRADPVGGSYRESFGLNGISYTIDDFCCFYQRGFTPSSNIRMGCWLNNSLLRQKVFWYRHVFSSNGLTATMAYYQEEDCCGDSTHKSYSKYIKKLFIQSFNSSQIKCICDCGNWLQNNYCKPVSSCLLEHFKSLPKNAHLLINILELYKCYIECDCGLYCQVRFAQHKYKAVYDAFYPWFFDLIKSTLGASENNDIHTVLLSVFYNWNAKMSDFVDTTSLPEEKIRGLGGYQIEANSVVQYFQNPNIQSQLKLGLAPQAHQLAKQIKAFGTSYAVATKQAIELVLPGIQ